MRATIDSAVRVVIPKEVREAAGLAPGLELEVRCRDGIVEIEPVQPEVKLVRKGSVTILSCPGMPRLTQKQVNKTLRDIRERRL